MTKVNKIGSDLLEFVHEDTGIAEVYKGDLALKKFNELESKATDTKIQDSKSRDYTNGLFWELINSQDLTRNEFVEFVKSARPEKLKVETGKTTFNKSKYDECVKEHNDKMQRCIDKYHVLIMDNTVDLATKEKSASEIMREFNELKKVVISKSQKEFQEPEFETLKISAEEALEIVLNAYNNYNLQYAADIENKRAIAIEQDKCLLKDISEDDFQLIKRLQRLINNESAFYKMFEFNPAYRYNAILYDSIEDFLNRDRGIDADVKLTLSNLEMSATRFIHRLRKDYCERCRNDKLQSDMLSMVESLKEK